MKTTLTDASGNSRQVYTDALGRNIETLQGNISTRFEFNAFSSDRH
jgi:hypothetical protein